MNELSTKEKCSLIEMYVDQEEVFQYCHFDPHNKRPTNPYRHDKHPGSCNWKWWKGLLYFFDHTFPFSNGTKRGINIYGAVELMHPPLFTFKDQVEFIFDKFVNNYNVSVAENEKRLQYIESKNKKAEEESSSPYTIFINKQKDWPIINYYTKYGLNKSILKKEFVLNVLQYTVIKNLNHPDERDVTGAFPSLTEANDLIIAYQYKDKFKLYFPLLQKGIKKPRFFGNINAKNTIEGYDQIFYLKNPKMIVQGSKKDYMTTRYALPLLKADIYATQNEGNYLPFKFNTKTKEGYKERWLLFDNDHSGIKNALRVMEHDEFTGMIILPHVTHEFKVLKDMSDLYEIYQKETLNIFKQSKFIYNGSTEAQELKKLYWKNP